MNSFKWSTNFHHMVYILQEWDTTNRYNSLYLNTWIQQLKSIPINHRSHFHMCWASYTACTSANGAVRVHVMFENVMFIIRVADSLQGQWGTDPVVAIVADEGAALLPTVLQPEMPAQRWRHSSQSGVVLYFHRSNPNLWLDGFQGSDPTLRMTIE